MSIVFYKQLHLVGLVLLSIAIGGWVVHLVGGGTRDNFKARGLVAGLHGTGMVLLLVAGFGLLAKLQLPWQATSWIGAKTLIWAGLGALPAVAFRGKSSPRERARTVLFGALVLIVGAVFLALNKPF